MVSQKPKVLVVDDSASDRMAFRRLLSGCGVELLDATHGAQALDIAEREPLLMVLLDIRMPGMSGFDVALGLKEIDACRHTPVIFVTQDSATELQRQAYEAGATDYLIITPENEELLRRKVATYIELFRTRHELEALLDRIQSENRKLYSENENYREQQADMLRRATHDPLTQLPNRVLFEDRLKAAIHRASRDQTSFAVVYVDVDNLKEINDRYGHSAGDDLLVGVGRRLADSLRASDTVARLGGDEFGLVLEGLEQVESALLLGQKISKRIGEPLPLRSNTDGQPVVIEPGASVGIAIYPDHGLCRDDLMMLADLAMYQVKRAGGRDFAIYAPADAGQAFAR